MAARDACGVRCRLWRCDKEAAINCRVGAPGHRGAYRCNTSGASAKIGSKDCRRDAWQVSRCGDCIPQARLAWNLPLPLSHCLRSEPCPVPLVREQAVLTYPLQDMDSHVWSLYVSGKEIWGSLSLKNVLKLTFMKKPIYAYLLHWRRWKEKVNSVKAWTSNRHCKLGSKLIQPL